MFLKEINYILAIQHHGSITKAAEELFISQPALSKFLKNIENQVGAPLFSRIGNQLIPTHIGTRYLTYISQIASLQDNWNMEYADLLGEQKGHVSITLPPMRSACIIPYTLPLFYSKYPDVQITIREESTMVQKHWLSSRNVDFAIHSDTEPHSPFIHEDLGKEEVVLIMSPSYPLAKMGEYRQGCRYPWLDLSLLKKEPFILNPPDQTTGRVSAQLLEQAEITPFTLLQTRNTEVAIRLAAEGTALAFAPETYVKKINFANPPLCFSVGHPKTEITLYAVHQKGQYIPSYAKYFLELVRGHMAAQFTDSSI